MQGILKTVKDSRTENVHIIMQADLNGADRLFGGVLMQWIDIVAAVCARRHSGSEVTTVCVDKLDFKNPAYINQTIYQRACITYVGNTSMEVKVSSYVENLKGERSLINIAYLVMVAIDENGNPKKVPKLLCETDAEKLESEQAVKRNDLRKARNTENY